MLLVFDKFFDKMNQEDQRKLIEAMISEIYLHPKETLIEVETASQAHGQKAEVQPQCPEDKESAIVEALKHFKMIQKN